jgi:uracil-DNA glycosylase
MQNAHQKILGGMLDWYIHEGVDEFILDEPQNRMVVPKMRMQVQEPPSPASQSSLPSIQTVPENTGSELMGAVESKKQAIELAQKVQSLDELREVIAKFEGLDLKQTATNMVFADGRVDGMTMLIGEAPGADEDRQGVSFVGRSGQLLDKILKGIGLDRNAEDAAKAVYMSNVLNWRPPGNRTPTPQEMEISRAFIERHIDLKKPEFLILCGGTVATMLLGSNDSISKLRGKVHQYVPQTLSGRDPIPAIVTYHPTYLLGTPSQKEKVWDDMLFFVKNVQRISA